MAYKMLNIIISTCPIGFPLALNIRDVTPTSEAISVKKLPLSNIANESIMERQEQLHKISSDLVKYDVVFFKLINLQKKKHNKD